MFEPQGRTRNRTQDLPKKGSAFITSSDHWTNSGPIVDQYVSAAVRIFWLAPELQLPACFLHALFELVHVIAFEFVSSSTVWFIPFPPL